MSPRWKQAAAAAATALISVAGLQAAGPAEAAPAAGSKTVYFTFDDGPGMGTAELLDATAAYDAKVSLFYVGRHGEQSPELVARAAAEGHVIGNHTYSHRRLPTMTGGEVEQELIKARNALEPYVSNCWRPPGWQTSPAIEQIAKGLGLRQTLSVMDPAESRRVFIPASWTDEDLIVSTVRERVFDGAMVTLHAETPGAGAQLRAFERLLPLLTAEGYRFKALPYCDMPTVKLLAVGDGVTSGVAGAVSGAGQSAGKGAGQSAGKGAGESAGKGAGRSAGNYRGQLDAMLRRGAEPHGLNFRWVGDAADGPGLHHDEHDGWTTQQVDRNISRLQSTHQPDVILVNAGAVDVQRGATADTVARRMAALLARIRQNQPDVKVLVSIPPALSAPRPALSAPRPALSAPRPAEAKRTPTTTELTAAKRKAAKPKAAKPKAAKPKAAKPSAAQQSAAKQTAALQRAMRDVIRNAGAGFYAVDLRGPALDGGARAHRTIANRYYQALRDAVPGSSRWAAAPQP
ncbi:polysaccharide deacetylase family protein [Actinoplanes sp. NPDC023936]|uniref:polysaccharide deacetylase family protein n=1 Tax=Actinoplanes sp. NPDC023936 TaxID=3154910 RepID=UPI0033DB12A8